MAPEGHQQRRDVRERGGQQQEQRGLGAEPRAVATLDWLREELVKRHEHCAEGVRTPAEGVRTPPTPSRLGRDEQVWLLLVAIALVSRATDGARKGTNNKDARPW